MLSLGSVGVVMRYLKILGNNENLPLKLLAMKTAMLIALVSADRGATITSLNLDFMVESQKQIRFFGCKANQDNKARFWRT